MTKNKVALVLLSFASLVQASNDSSRNMLLGATALAAATTGTILVWRAMTHNQDIGVVSKIDEIINTQDYYNNANVIIDKKIPQYDLEEKIDSVTTVMCEGSLNFNATKISVVTNKHIEQAHQLNDWDLWMRSWFNPQVNYSMSLIKDHVIKIKKARTFLLEEHGNYFTGKSLVTTSSDLIVNINPEYSNLAMTDLPLMKAEGNKNRLSNDICTSAIFAQCRRPHYVCHSGLSTKSCEVTNLLRGIDSKYPKLKADLNKIKAPLIVLSAVIQEMPQFKEEEIAEIAAEKERAEIRKQQEAARRAEEAHQAQLRAVRAQEIAVQAQVKQAQAAERQAKAQQQEADTNRKRFAAEERNTAIKRRAQAESITEAQAQKKYEEEDAWNCLAGAAIVGVASLLS